MLELVRRRAASCRRSSPTIAVRYFLTGELNTEVADVAGSWRS
jgi:hypothetical protein